jgi:hypothetical protein
MDPVNVIVSALVVGASEVSKDLVKDTYAALKSLIGAILHRKKGAADPVAEAEADPRARDKVVAAVKKSGIAEDQATVDAAVALLKAADAARPGIEGGVVGQINAAGGKVLVVGTNVGTINFS